MRLKRVRIFGFKTFADKTEFDLDGDIVAIVGPNGCGKSNIVDAILWGLGEPNARNLRATNSQDVIFNGSAKRKPVGYAEVTLIFDNEDGALPLDAAEVAICRRLTRNGDSHFSINRKTCRLKDIYDLLADSGLGRAGYAIVGQREIDQALSASAEERRAWIDEAAGVQRFRAKRLESIRRLEAARNHLERIDQILADIEFQREPLREEAELAKRYQSIRASLNELETHLLVKDVQDSVYEADRLESQLAQSAEGATRQLAELEATESLIQQIGEDVAELERKLDAQRELRQSFITAAERAESAILLSTQRLKSLDELEENLNAELLHGEDQTDEVAAELLQGRAELERLNSEIEQLEQTGSGSSSAVQELRAEVALLDRALSEARAIESAQVRREADRQQALARQSTLKKELAGIESALPRLKEAIAEAESVLGKAIGSSADIESQLSVQIDLLNAGKEKRSAVDRATRTTLAGLSILDGKRRGLESTLETMEGLGQGSQAVLALVRKGELPNEYVPVSTAITTEERFATAIETALGGAAHDLIVENDALAKRAIQLLKERRLGRATFQPLTLIRSHSGGDLKRLCHEPGVVGVAADLVEVESRVRPVIQGLLGRILVVETLDDSLRLAKTSGWSRMVTLDGEVVHSGGAVTGGRVGRQTNGIVHRRAELNSVVQEIQKLREQLAKEESDSLELDQSEAQIQVQISELRTQLQATESTKAEAEKWLNELRQEQATTQRESDRLLREFESLNQLRVDDNVDVPDIPALSQQRDEAMEKLARLSAEAESSLRRLNDLQEQLRLIQERVRRAEERLSKNESARESREKRLAGLNGERDTWAEKIRVSEIERVGALAKAAELAVELDATQLERKERLEESFRLAEEAKSLERSLQQLGTIANRLEVERARCDAKRAASVQRLVEEYGIGEDEAVAHQLPENLPEDAPQIVGRLRRDLKALGEVNLGSIEAFERLTQRFTELDAQRHDVRASMEEIHHAVKELDRLTRDRFLGTFEQVREAFKITFSELFGGGEAELSLTDTEHLLSSGVNVEVTIPGKKRQRLELLSGGERSMSAVAFLFALLRVKPSPLVVLDEVDAPLDGRNVERYVDVLKSFGGNTQFLVITHNPVTIEAAPIWFGVTMQEPGCTTVIPCRLPERDALIDAVVPDAMLQGPSKV